MQLPIAPAAQLTCQMPTIGQLRRTPRYGVMSLPAICSTTDCKSFELRANSVTSYTLPKQAPCHAQHPQTCTYNLCASVPKRTLIMHLGDTIQSNRTASNAIYTPMGNSPPNSSGLTHLIPPARSHRRRLPARVKESSLWIKGGECAHPTISRCMQSGRAGGHLV